MEEESSADAMSATVDPIPVTTGFDLSIEEVVLILCLGLCLRGSTSPLAQMPPELVRTLADHFRNAQISFLLGNGRLTPVRAPVVASSESSRPPHLQRNAPVRRSVVLNSPQSQPFSALHK
jgi:hypothetical protein